MRPLRRLLGWRLWRAAFARPRGRARRALESLACVVDPPPRGSSLVAREAA